MSVAAFRRLLCNKQANVAITWARNVPLVFAVGFGIDYTSAAYREDQLNAFADSAALAAVTPAMMASTDAASITAAQNTFNAQATAMTGINYTAGSGVTVNVADTLTTRTVTVTYTAQSQNAFANVLGTPTIAVGGTSRP